MLQFNFFLLEFLTNLNFFIILLSGLLSFILITFSKINNYNFFNKNNSVFKKIKFSLIFILTLSFFFTLLSFFLYLIILKRTRLNIFNLHSFIENSIIIKNSFFFLDFDYNIFSFVLLIIGYIVGYLSFLSLDNRLFWKNFKFILFFNFFLIIVYTYCFTNNIIILFLSYEGFLLPSFLIVYFISPSRRSTQASLYFLMWTQLGSLLVLIAVIYIITITGHFNLLKINNHIFTNVENIILFCLLFFGFGLKIPIWPAHYWLTKTHVEAPAGFSMYLSGFLVKTAVYGFYKLTTVIGFELNTSFFYIICLLGIIDASLKMWGQTDLKKLVAYATIQEMNIIFISFSCGDSNLLIGGIIFCFTHSILSALMFFIVDCVQRRYYSRSIIEISGILHNTPNLAFIIIIMLLLYSGIPGTLKFVSEFMIFIPIFEISPILSIILIFLNNVIGVIGFSKVWYNVVFGLNQQKKKLPIKLDLTIKEIYICIFCIFCLVFPIFFINIFF